MFSARKDVMPKLTVTKDRSAIWKPRALEGVSLFKARFTHFAFNKHVHEEFGIGVIEHGTQKFHYRSDMYFAPPGSMITVNPDMIHDGEAATETGYQYRMAYVPLDLAQEILQEVSASQAKARRYFSDPVTFDRDVAQRLLAVLRLLDQPSPPLLEAQSRFVQALGDLFIRHARPHSSPSKFAGNPAVIRHACEFIRTRMTDNLSLDEIAGEIGLSRFHFLRLFKASTGFSPHAYLIMRRLELVRTLIQQGFSLSLAAHEAGFADQSHMTRQFKAAYGITPGQFQQAVLKK